MLDTDAYRFDVARAVRELRGQPDLELVWEFRRVNTVLGIEKSAVVHRVRLCYEASPESLIIDYDYEFAIHRDIITVPGSGRRVAGAPLVMCPLGCGRKARVIWLRPDNLERGPACRDCVGVEYATVKSGELRRAELSYQRIRSGLGLAVHQTHEPRLGQHRTTYLREAARLKAAGRRLRAAGGRAPLAGRADDA